MSAEEDKVKLLYDLIGTYHSSALERANEIMYGKNKVDKKICDGCRKRFCKRELTTCCYHRNIFNDFSDPFYANKNPEGIMRVKLGTPNGKIDWFCGECIIKCCSTTSEGETYPKCKECHAQRSCGGCRKELCADEGGICAVCDSVLCGECHFNCPEEECNFHIFCRSCFQACIQACDMCETLTNKNCVLAPLKCDFCGYRECCVEMDKRYARSKRGVFIPNWNEVKHKTIKGLCCIGCMKTRACEICELFVGDGGLKGCEGCNKNICERRVCGMEGFCTECITSILKGVNNGEGG